MSKKTSNPSEPPLNWILILALSVLGAAMGLTSVLGWTRGFELYLWIALALLAAIVIAKRVIHRKFLHGFWTGLIGGGASPLIQVLMWAAYIDNNPELTREYDQLPKSFDPKLFVLAASPLIAAFSGVVQGALSWAAGKMLAKNPEHTRNL